VSIGDEQITIQTWNWQFHKSWSPLDLHKISIGQNFIYSPHRSTFETQTGCFKSFSGSRWKILKEGGGVAWAWFHDGWTCSAKVCEY
jgi:hypothetical protein